MNKVQYICVLFAVFLFKQSACSATKIRKGGISKLLDHKSSGNSALNLDHLTQKHSVKSHSNPPAHGSGHSVLPVQPLHSKELFPSGGVELVQGNHKPVVEGASVSSEPPPVTPDTALYVPVAKPPVPVSLPLTQGPLPEAPVAPTESTTVSTSEEVTSQPAPEAEAATSVPAVSPSSPPDPSPAEPAIDSAVPSSIDLATNPGTETPADPVTTVPNTEEKKDPLVAPTKKKKIAPILDYVKPIEAFCADGKGAGLVGAVKEGIVKPPYLLEIEYQDTPEGQSGFRNLALACSRKAAPSTLDAVRLKKDAIRAHYSVKNGIDHANEKLVPESAPAEGATPEGS